MVSLFLYYYKSLIKNEVQKVVGEKKIFHKGKFWEKESGKKLIIEKYCIGSVG